MDNGKLVVFEEGQLVFAEGDEADSMYILLDGAVELTKKGQHGSTVLKTVSQPNEFFGEMALIDGKPRSATARAVKMSSLIVVDAANFERMLQANGAFAVKVIRALSARIRHANLHIQELAETDPKDRVMRAVSDYSFRFGDKASGDARYVDLTAMRDWINGHAGLPLEAIDATLARMRRNKELVEQSLGLGEARELAVVSGDFLRAWDRRRQASPPAAG